MSEVIRQLESDYQCRNFFKIKEVPSIQEFYEYISRYNSKQFNNIINNILSQIHKSNKRPIKTYFVDATPVATDINILKEFITKERLEKLKLKWGYSTTKKYYIGFKVTVTLDKETLCPVSILIHPGALHDTIIYEEVLKELKRRRLFKRICRDCFRWRRNRPCRRKKESIYRLLIMLFIDICYLLSLINEKPKKHKDAKKNYLIILMKKNSN